MAQDQLQTLKLEISKNFTLLPYERIAFHKILGLVKSETGMQILLKEMNLNPLVRESAIMNLKDINNKEVQTAFALLLKKKITDIEKIYIFENFEHFGTPEIIPIVIEFIEENKVNEDQMAVLSKAFSVLKAVGGGSDTVKDYLYSIASNKDSTNSLRSLAVIALSAFKDIVIPGGKDNKAFLEEILKENSEELICAGYNSISILNDDITNKIRQDKSDEEDIFTYSPEKDDRAILDIRVLIGKMTSKFDTYSDKNKIAIINAMISSNHRELLIYLMKALNSSNTVLMDMTLDLLLANTQKLHDPDKLFRNLISLSIDSPRGGRTIVAIFEKYFNNLKETRRNMLFKDKLFNYMIVTLETYFETYRKDFMVAEVVEKNFPENVQKIRRFILNKFPPEYKKKIFNFLKSNDSSILKNILTEIGGYIPYINESEKDELECFLEMLYEKEIRSREIYASRIDDIIFEKRYLKDRIIRICEIIGKLKIENGASPLVIIYNYVKKYTDKEILDAASYTLSMLNYSYMLGELEVLLSAGDESEQQKAVQYLSLYSDQRSLNIILDYLKQHADSSSDVIVNLLNTLLKQNLFGNVAAGSALKEIIEKNQNIEIKRLAILCLGKCAREADIQYLDGLFNSFKDNPPKEAIIMSVEHIMNHALNINKRPIIQILSEYIKDPGIKVRILSCYLLTKMGNKNALKSIMDMMTIKNKKIQREIISIFENLKSIDFAYFLISLLKDEYAISADIISLLSLLPKEELSEIDHFITNIFKKHEFIGAKETADVTTQPVNGLIEDKCFILNIEINNFIEQINTLSIIEMKMLQQQINDIVIPEISGAGGTVTHILHGKIMAYYRDPLIACKTALSIHDNFIKFNSTRLAADRFKIFIQILSENIKIINDEVINLDESEIRHLNSMPVYNRIITDENTKSLIDKEYNIQPIPDMEFIQCTINNRFQEIIGPVNFINLSALILNKLSKEIDERKKRELELEAESKQKQSMQNKSPEAIAYAQAMDDLGRILKDDLNNVNKYIQKRSTDRELLTNVSKMLSNVYKRFFVEKSKIFSEME
ncbi:MAG: hypothetical protein V1874_05815 [Spirochaetota bacterium]